MKKHWLRGILLGVSLALLLVGGAALAQGLRVTVDQGCLECWPRTAGWPPPAEHIMEVTFSGYDPAEYLCARLTMEGFVWGEGCWDPTLPGPPCALQMAVECQTQTLMTVDDTCLTGAGETALGSSDVSAQAVHGEWVWRAWQEDDAIVTDGPVFANLRYAETCLEEEFVPEPGTMVLLGSGLAGLAGYATLRWRTRE